jgi:hypothetical protein
VAWLFICLLFGSLRAAPHDQAPGYMPVHAFPEDWGQGRAEIRPKEFHMPAQPLSRSRRVRHYLRHYIRLDDSGPVVGHHACKWEFLADYMRQSGAAEQAQRCETLLKSADNWQLSRDLAPFTLGLAASIALRSAAPFELITRDSRSLGAAAELAQRQKIMAQMQKFNERLALGLQLASWKDVPVSPRPALPLPPADLDLCGLAPGEDAGDFAADYLISLRFHEWYVGEFRSDVRNMHGYFLSLGLSKQAADWQKAGMDQGAWTEQFSGAAKRRMMKTVEEVNMLIPNLLYLKAKNCAPPAAAPAR